MNDLSSLPPKVVVAGHICLDVIPAFGFGAGDLESILVPGKLIEVGPSIVSTGGAVPNTGVALHRLGVPTTLIGKVGNDLFGNAILDVLRRQHENLAKGMIVAEDESSSYTLVLNPPGVDRIFLHSPGANDTFHPLEVRLETLQDARFLHFGYPPLMRATYSDGGEALAQLFKKVRSKGVAVSLDMAKPDPESIAGRVNWTSWLERVLPEVDLFAPSFDEILFMLDRSEFDRHSDYVDLSSEKDLRLLTRISNTLLEMGAVVVALKLGASGLYLRTTDAQARLSNLFTNSELLSSWADRELLSSCFEVDVAGTTGSGDCTIAGLIAGLLNNLPAEEVVVRAVAVGACSVEKADASSGVVSWDLVSERIEKGWSRHNLEIRSEEWQFDSEYILWKGPGDPGV